MKRDDRKTRTGNVFILDHYRVKREPETFRQIGDVAMALVARLIREPEVREK
jgi:hypothetical protein